MRSRFDERERLVQHVYNYNYLGMALTMLKRKRGNAW